MPMFPDHQRPAMFEDTAADKSVKSPMLVPVSRFFILSNCLNRVQLYKTIKTIVHYLKLNHIINNQTITLKKKKTLLNHALNIQKSRQRPFKTISISTGKKKI
jgi:hypothetical protein